MPTVGDSPGTGGGGPATSGASSTSDSAPASAVSGAGCSAGAQRSALVQGRLIQKPSTASNRSSPASPRTQSGPSQLCGLATSLSPPPLGVRLQSAHSPEPPPYDPPTGTGGGGPATSGASATSDSAPASAVSGAGCSAGAQRSELVQGRLIQKPSTASNRSSPASARTQSGSSQICGLATSLSAPDLGLRLQ